MARQIDSVSIDGWVSSPRVYRSTSRGIFLYVNGRFVRDRVIQHALFAGYRQRLVKGRFPVAVLFVTLPSDRVDVNVHPTKHEVRFARQRLVHDLVQAAVEETLDRVERPRWNRERFAPVERLQGESRISEKREAGYEAESSSFAVRSSKLKAQGSILKTEGLRFRGESPTPLRDRGFQRPERRQRSTGHQPGVEGENWRFVPGRESESDHGGPEKGFSDLRIIGQLRNTYIVCETAEGLMLLDQHAAHERVLYEQLKKRSAALKKEAQRLLVPETIELGIREAGIMEELLPEFSTLGLEIEPFGTHTFVVRSVPAMLSGRAIEPLIREVVEKLAAHGFGTGLDHAIDLCLQLMACHGSIRARQALDDRQIRHLLRQLDDCDNPSHCPHGRPTWLQWTGRELEKAFGRI